MVGLNGVFTKGRLAMGLDIRLCVTPAEVIRVLDEIDNDEMRMAALAILQNMPGGRISTRPGSYAGIHRVRAVYAELKGIVPQSLDEVLPEDLHGSHLCHHSDCDGWYLPDDFSEPIWQDSFSIGSSQKLLAELWEIRGEPVAHCKHEWEEVFIAAFASVVTRTAIEFS